MLNDESFAVPLRNCIQEAALTITQVFSATVLATLLLSARSFAPDKHNGPDGQSLNDWIEANSSDVEDEDKTDS